MEEITTTQNYLSQPDENGQPRINPSYYKTILSDFIDRYMQDNNIQPDKITNNKMLAICQSIYESIFSNHVDKDKPTNPTRKCNIPYSQYNIATLLDIYKSTLIKYNCFPSLFGFSILTGIQEETVKRIVTPSQLEILNIRREMLRNALSDDRMGRIVLANNDSSYGLEYEKKNVIERETVKQGLNLTELPKLS